MKNSVFMMLLSVMLRAKSALLTGSLDALRASGKG